MKIHAVVTQANGIISERLQALFVGDSTDETDKQQIAAFGDPQINLAGSFVDPQDTTFTFQMPTTEKYVGLTTQMTSNTVRFMKALPSPSNPNQQAPIQGELDVISPDPGRAATVWHDVILSRIGQAMTALRNQTTVPTIPDVTV